MVCLTTSLAGVFPGRSTKFEVEAPTLVWASGLRYPKPPVPGFEGAEENATGAGLVSLTERLAVPGRRVIVVGAGLIGTETAATLAAEHDVTLVDMLDRPLARKLSDPDKCLAEIDAKIAGELGSIAAMIGSGQRDAARKRLLKLDSEYGGLALPRSLDLLHRIDGI